MYLHNKNNMRHFCITNKKKQKTSIFIFGQWVFWPIVVIVLLVIIFILPGSHVITLFGDFICGILGNDSNLLIVFYVQIMPDDFVMQLHRF